MKIRERALAILLSMVMVLTFMPALAFAEGEDAEGIDHAPAAEVSKDAAETVGEDWLICSGRTYWAWPDEGSELYGWVTPDDESLELQFQWLKNGTPLAEWQDLTEIDENGDLCDIIYPEDPGTYTFSVREKDDPTQTASATFILYLDSVINGIVYGPEEDNDNEAWAEELNTSVTGNIVIPSTVTLADGKTRTVTSCWVSSPNASSISIPPTVKYIWPGVGLQTFSFDIDGNVSDAVPIPGFVIFGTNGSAAQVHANKYGIPFRDLAAEAAAAQAAAEAARQGSIVGGLPKVKISKPSAAKKSINVKWKKLTKKQLKKVTNIEVWVCPNAAFGSADTIMKFAGKKKASLKVKGLAKGTYFVKVRAIKNVGGVKQYTAWSKTKKIKVKK